MRITNKLILYLLLIIGFSSYVYSRPRLNQNGNDSPGHIPVPISDVVIQQIGLDPNNISNWFYNTGIFNQDLRISNTPGLMWPKGTGKFACFTAGLSMGCYVNFSGTPELREAMCSYKGEYAPGYVDTNATLPVAKTDSRFRLYKVFATDNSASGNPDYFAWGDMVPYGAPYVDINQNGIFDPGIDKPGMKDAAQTIFGVLTDGFPEEHKLGEGFGGGTQPMFSEVHITAWAYSSPGLEDIEFVKWVLINKSKHDWAHLYIGITVDPDLGEPNDDYIGCDTALNMGFDYNGEDMDGTGQGVSYGLHPPAFGMDYFVSPVNRNVDPPDTMGLTSYVYFTNTSTAGPLCEKDPNGEALPAYYLLQGIKKDQTPWVVPPGGVENVTKFTYPGDPETGTGWTEGTTGGQITGAVQNCGGPTVYTGTIVATNVYGDRRFIFNSGADNFTMKTGETQTFILAQFVARGNNNLNSVTRLKQVDKVAQKIFDANFNVIPPPAPPQVHVSTRQTTNLGTFALNLSWGDTSEYYLYKDTLFRPDSLNVYYKFEGYEIYEVRPSASSIPDLYKPETINDDIKLVNIYDLADTVGFIIDTIAAGITNAPFQVIPPYKMNAPTGFPGSGISRSITITTTQFPEEHGGRTDLIYGNKYKFIVSAYAYNNKPLKGMAMLRNSLASQLMTIIPEAPLAGTQFYYKNGDTLNTSRRDLGVIPIISAQELLQNAKYRIVFNNPDTSYKILRSFDNWASFQTLKNNLRFTNNNVRDDSARIYDGILFKVMKIQMSELQPAGNDTGNLGVIRDTSAAVPRLWGQTRYNGWDYLPAGNRFVEGSKYVQQAARPWQSKSMSIAYPSKNTYIGIKSALLPEGLRKVQIVFTGYGNGQQAYEYVAIASNNYQYQQGMKEVPLKVYEIESTDSTANPRQLNCAFLEFPDSSRGEPDGKWNPTADSLGGKEVLYIFNSNYDPNPNSFYDKNLFLFQGSVDVMYVWAPKLLSPGANFSNGDQLIIYPYTVTRPEITAGYPLYYEIESRQPIIGDPNLAKSNNDLEAIRVVPNPYYGFNNLETPITGRFITFRRLPKQCTIKIYTLNGDMIRRFDKNDLNSTLQWDMTNLENVPIASGMYIVLVDAPGIGQKVLKIAIFTPEERIDF
jgi:hypothetical protein